MKRIKAACITQTLCFSNHDGETTEYAKKAIVQEYQKYKAQLEKAIEAAEKGYQDAHEALIRIQENINTLNGELCDAPESDMEPTAKRLASVV